MSPLVLVAAATLAGCSTISSDGSLLGFISRSDILQAVVTDPPLSVWR